MPRLSTFTVSNKRAMKLYMFTHVSMKCALCSILFFDLPLR
jgi:hypothetical protein